MFTLLVTGRFEQRLVRFLRRHPNLRSVVVDTLRKLESDPFEPRLRLHALSGELSGLHAVSVTYRFRIVLVLRITESEIVLLDIGTHDEVYS